MNVITVKLDAIASEKYFRSDFQYQNYLKESKPDNEHSCRFLDLFEIIQSKANYKDIDGEFYYCQIGDVGKDETAYPIKLNFDDRNLIDDSYYSKIEKGDMISVEKGDILLSFLIPQDVNIKGKSLKIDESNYNNYYTSAFIQIRPKQCPNLLYYCLMGILYRDIYSISRIRKGYTGYATISSDDLLNAVFEKKVIDKILCNRDMLNGKITELENEILLKKSDCKSSKAIIDDVFAREFSFDIDTFNKLKTHTKFSVSSLMFANNPDLRFSVKFHRDAGNFVMTQLCALTDKKIKHFLAEPILLGASVSPSDYTEDGDFRYISMATIKNWRFDSDSAQTVSKEYSDKNQMKTVKKNDILLARSGEGTIGKVALIEDEDLKGIFADFTMRIRLKNYNCKFAYYFFRTTYFQYLIEIYKKGLGNNTNIFPIVVQEFPLLDISLDEQQRIVDEIQSEIDKQNSIKTQIVDLRNEIDKIIENAVKT